MQCIVLLDNSFSVNADHKHMCCLERLGSEQYLLRKHLAAHLKDSLHNDATQANDDYHVMLHD
jgi:hypothetical protein